MEVLLFFLAAFIIEVLAGYCGFKVFDEERAKWWHICTHREGKPGQSRGFLRFVLGAVHKHLHLINQRNAT